MRHIKQPGSGLRTASTSMVRRHRRNGNGRDGRDPRRPERGVAAHNRKVKTFYKTFYML
jgi:hypothetical protein